MVKKLSKWIVNFFLILFLVITLLLAWISFQNKDSPPALFGFHILTILTGSMEPYLEPGDLIIIRENSDIHVNDVVTYEKTPNHYVTHRVVDILEQKGETLFQTKGDANNIADEDLVRSEQLVGSLLFPIPKAGLIMNFLKSLPGIILLVTIFLISVSFPYLKKILSNPEEAKTNE